MPITCCKACKQMMELLTFIIPDVDKPAFLGREMLQRCNLVFLGKAQAKSLPCSKLAREHFVKLKWHNFLKVSCKYVDLAFLCNFLVTSIMLKMFFTSTLALVHWSSGLVLQWRLKSHQCSWWLQGLFTYLSSLGWYVVIGYWSRINTSTWRGGFFWSCQHMRQNM